MAHNIVSFGFRHHDVLYAVQQGILIVDVRHFANPHVVTALRPLDGRDPRVGQYIRHTTPDYQAKYEAVRKLAQDYPGDVWIGCTGGRHRSVYLAIEIGAYLEVPVSHKDLV